MRNLAGDDGLERATSDMTKRGSMTADPGEPHFSKSCSPARTADFGLLQFEMPTKRAAKLVDAMHRPRGRGSPLSACSVSPGCCPARGLGFPVIREQTHGGSLIGLRGRPPAICAMKTGLTLTVE